MNKLDENLAQNLAKNLITLTHKKSISRIEQKMGTNWHAVRLTEPDSQDAHPEASSRRNPSTQRSSISKFNLNYE